MSVFVRSYPPAFYATRVSTAAQPGGFSLPEDVTIHTKVELDARQLEESLIAGFNRVHWGCRCWRCRFRQRDAAFEATAIILTLTAIAIIAVVILALTRHPVF